MNLVRAFLLFLSLAVAQAFLGGARLLFILPAYAILGLTGLLVLTSWRPKEGKVLPDIWCVAAAVLFAGVIAVRAWFSSVDYLARPDLLCAAGALLVYLLVATRLTQPRLRLWLLGGLLLLSLTQIAVGAVQFQRGDDFMFFRWSGTVLDFLRSADYRGRASGFYICPNHLAGNLEMVGSLSLATACWSRLAGWLKILFGYCGVGCFAGLLLTGSRGGFLSSAVALSVLAILSILRVRGMMPQNLGRVLGGVALSGLLLAGGCLFLVKQSRALQRRAEALSHTEMDVRPKLWAATRQQFQAAPLVGTGSGTYLYYGRLFRDPQVQQDPVHAHCDYLELLGEYGLVGAAALALFLAAHLRAGWRDFAAMRAVADWNGDSTGRGGAATSNAAALNLGALAALASLLAHSAVDFNLHIPANAMLLAWVCGLLANPGRDLTPNLPGVTAEARVGFRIGWTWPALVLPCLGAALLLAAWRWLPGEFYAEKARVALRDAHYLRAANFALDGLEAEENNPDLYFYLGEARLQQGLQTQDPISRESFLTGATEALEDGRTLFPQDVRLALRLGAALDELGRYADAEAPLKEALRWDPKSGRVWVYYAHHLQEQGLLDEARAAYLRAQEFGQAPLAQEGLGQLEAGGGVLRPAQ